MCVRRSQHEGRNINGFSDEPCSLASKCQPAPRPGGRAILLSTLDVLAIRMIKSWATGRGSNVSNA